MEANNLPRPTIAWPRNGAYSTSKPVNSSFAEVVFGDVGIDPEDLPRVKLCGQWGFIKENGAFATNQDDDVGTLRGLIIESI